MQYGFNSQAEAEAVMSLIEREGDSSSPEIPQKPANPKTRGWTTQYALDTSTTSTPEMRRNTVKKSISNLLYVPGNDVCADCGSANPKWASTSLGVFMCIECSGIHRSLGVHISTVKSVELDTWEEGMVDFMRQTGNKKINAIYEFKLPPGQKKPLSSASRQEKTDYIKAKYVDKLFADPTVVTRDNQEPVILPNNGFSLNHYILHPKKR